MVLYVDFLKEMKHKKDVKLKTSLYLVKNVTSFDK